MLDENGEVRLSVIEMLEKENNMKAVKLSWLSWKDPLNAYWSMVVYVTIRADAARLLKDIYFVVDGESALTLLLNFRRGPTQRFRCFGVGHKAISCTRPQLCNRCAQLGHLEKAGKKYSPRCPVCSGPHDSSGRQCRILDLATNVPVEAVLANGLAKAAECTTQHGERR